MADQATPPGRDPSLFDAYAPAQMARRVEVAGVAKAGLPLLPLLTLALLAGAFIAFGAMLFTLTMTDHGMGLGPSRILGGVTFSLGLVLVVVGGAELFTGNLLLVMGWAGRKIATAALLRNWGVAYAGNLAGAVAMAFLAYGSGYMDLGAGAVGLGLVAELLSRIYHLSAGSSYTLAGGYNVPGVQTVAEARDLGPAFQQFASEPPTPEGTP